MNPDELVERQQRLLARSAELRRSLATQSLVIQKPLAMADQARYGLQWLYHHPYWPIGAMLGLAILRPRRTLAWGSRLWWTWKTIKRAQKLLRR